MATSAQHPGLELRQERWRGAGAGDAFGGGFVAWWNARGLGRDDLRDDDLVLEATRFAALVAARTCERPGASPPHLSELG